MSREESRKGEGENRRVGLSARNRTEVELHTSFPTSSSGVQKSHVVLGRGLDARDGSQTIGERVDAGGKQGRSEEGRIGGGVPNGHGLGGFPMNSTPVNGVDSHASNREGEGCREGCQPATVGGCLVREA